MLTVILVAWISVNIGFVLGLLWATNGHPDRKTVARPAAKS